MESNPTASSHPTLRDEEKGVIDESVEKRLSDSAPPDYANSTAVHSSAAPSGRETPNEKGEDVIWGVVDESVEKRLSESSPPDYANSTAVHSSAAPSGRETPNEKGAGKEDVFWVDFEPNDPRMPMNYSRSKKWVMTIIAAGATFLCSAGVDAYSFGFESMMRDLNCTEFQATVGLSVYPLGFAVVPMFTAAFSEEFGRRPLYIVTSIGFACMFILIALAPNIQAVIVGRFLQGAFSSTGATMVGGTIADIWAGKDRGPPMAVFSLCAVFSMGVAGVAAGWIEENPNLGWKWIQWIQLILAGIYVFLVIFFLPETRATIVLHEIAKKKRKETGDNRYKPKLSKLKVGRLIYISCTRPLRLLITEPVVTSFISSQLWIGFCWGVLFCLIESVSGVFRTLHHFSVGQTGTAFVTVAIGSGIGALTNMYQEKLYQKHYSKHGTEARLFGAMLAAFLLPIGMFIYAWSSFSFVHWIALCIGIVLFMWGTFIVYCTVFSYLADCYGPYASSALAAQSLFRNILGTVFPLFTQQMYRRLDYKWANTLFGCITILLMPIPFILFRYGPKIRMLSKFSREALESGQAK
ncbi:Polyamine transporter 4 [Leucoagaricus sp. SymC.cos]|nr:Polyamine transporter 4 [Leucoagaricus sp. SymC.cos]